MNHTPVIKSGDVEFSLDETVENTAPTQGRHDDLVYEAMALQKEDESHVSQEAMRIHELYPHVPVRYIMLALQQRRPDMYLDKLAMPELVEHIITTYEREITAALRAQGLDAITKVESSPVAERNASRVVPTQLSIYEPESMKTAGPEIMKVRFAGGIFVTLQSPLSHTCRDKLDELKARFDPHIAYHEKKEY